MRKRPWKRYGATVAIVVGGLYTGYHYSYGTEAAPSGNTANIWIDSNGGTCVDNASLTAYVDADACGSFAAALATCDNGDTIYVKTSSNYAGETLTNAAGNSRTSACTVEAEPGTSDIQFSSDFTLGTVGSGDGPDYITIKHVQCGSDTSSFTNSVNLNIYDQSNNNVFDDWDCPYFDLFDASNVTIKNSDWGPCGSSSGRSCIARIANSNTTINAQGPTIEDSNFHDIWCGTGSAATCASFHTDGMAVFGSRNLVLRRVKFWKNDITNIRFQNNTSNGRTNENVTIENAWFGLPCQTTAGTNCTGGGNANAFDIDNEAAGFILRFSSFAQDSRPQCGAPGDACGTTGSPATFLGNIYSTNASFCGYTKVTRSYNAENHWSTSSDSVCSGTGNNMGSNVSYVTGSGVIDFHLSGSNNADNLVASGCIATDIDQASRAGSNCDAGSDER